MEWIQVPDPNERLAAVSKIDAQLATILPQRDSLPKALDRLAVITTDDMFVEEAFERTRLWQDSGLYYAHTTRFNEAIQLFSTLHEKLCFLRVKKNEWLPCGMPLVWMSDYYRNLRCPHLAFKYLVLSAISDAIRDRGIVNADAGFYWRARWVDGLSDKQITNFMPMHSPNLKRTANIGFSPNTF
jgi:hypothetical protein